MSDNTRSEQERRQFLRLDLTENVVALDSEGRPIGRVERVGGGGMQIRIDPESPIRHFERGSRLNIRVVEPGDIQQSFTVEVRDCEGDILGVQFFK